MDTLLDGLTASGGEVFVTVSLEDDWGFGEGVLLRATPSGRADVLEPIIGRSPGAPHVDDAHIYWRPRGHGEILRRRRRAGPPEGFAAGGDIVGLVGGELIVLRGPDVVAIATESGDERAVGALPDDLVPVARSASTATHAYFLPYDRGELARVDLRTGEVSRPVAPPQGWSVSALVTDAERAVVAVTPRRARAGDARELVVIDARGARVLAHATGHPLAVDASHVYTHHFDAEFRRFVIGRARLADGACEPFVDLGTTGSPLAAAFADGHLVWVARDRIYAAPTRR